jgi:hypothetical protein
MLFGSLRIRRDRFWFSGVIAPQTREKRVGPLILSMIHFRKTIEHVVLTTVFRGIARQ